MAHKKVQMIAEDGTLKPIDTSEYNEERGKALMEITQEDDAFDAYKGSQRLGPPPAMPTYVPPMPDKGSDYDLDERVNHPSYYNQGPYLIADKDYKAGDRIPIECIDIIRDMPGWKANNFKYLWRCGLKQEEGISIEDKELEDMEKALWYLKEKIEHVKLERYKK